MTTNRGIGCGLVVVVASWGLVAPVRAAEETCFGRTPTIVSGDDRIEGTAGDDVIVARGEVLLILAGEGDDLVCGGSEVRIVHGGYGDDKLSPGEGSHWRRAYGDSGHDLLVGADDSSNRLDGGNGDDVLVGGLYYNAINGGPGSDELTGGDYIDRLRGGPGRDHLDGGGDLDLLYPGPDDDSISGGPGNDRVFELARRDSAGMVGNDDIDGGDGRDVLWAVSYDTVASTDPVEVDLAQGTATFGGTHTIAGVEDVVLGHDGPVRVIGDAEDNWFDVSGSPGVEIDGGAGDDVVDAKSGDNDLKGGDGSDTLRYRWAHSVTVDLEAGVAYTSFGVSRLAGFENIEGSCNGADDEDVLLGDEGPNVIDGGCGDDRLEGRGGDDSLDGGDGDDSLDGGDGTDECVNGESVQSCEGR